MIYGGERGITPGFLPSTLRAITKNVMFKIAPGDFVEQGFSPGPLAHQYS
jgi:hypothetical protein